jgi:hypothetical protein
MATREARSASWEDSVASATEDSVVRWRMLVLLRAGYAWDDALELATETDVDLHTAADLVKRGCASETARRILL